MPLGTEVGLGLRDIVFDLDPAIPRKRADRPHPIFGPCLLWPRSPISATAELVYYFLLIAFEMNKRKIKRIASTEFTIAR